jgi:MerR family regulatory protein
VDETLLSIGQVAAQADVPTSTIRYYERRGLLLADARASGQRRYKAETLRRLLHAANVTEWKAIAARRLTALDEHIGELQHARDILAGALLCRYDHPATDCRIMGTEIDRRIERNQPMD